MPESDTFISRCCEHDFYFGVFSSVVADTGYIYQALGIVGFDIRSIFVLANMVCF